VPDEVARRALAQFLRRRRRTLDPVAAGFPLGNRRVPGLRREEVALLAGVSPSWYTYLEQGRPIQASAQVIDSIARVLRLSAEEHRYVELLATGKAGHRVLAAAPDVLRAVDDIARSVHDVPLYVADRRGDLVAWNREATEWFTDFGLLPERDRNMVLWMLADPLARERFVDWELDARDLLGRFRAAVVGIFAEPRTVELVDQLMAVGPWVRKWWDEQEARPMTPRLRSLRHPVHGVCLMRAVVSFVAGAEDLGLVLHVPAGTFGQADGVARR
jgi:transcriptional regulator with XRE-family HTH domain